MNTAYHAKYFAYELTKRIPSDSIQKFTSTLLDAQVDLNPHQVEAALFAFRSPLSNGAILADEVGLGKTIEAGLVIAQKWAEQKRKMLIIVPSNLRKQWFQELRDKFFLPSLILETKSFNLIFNYTDDKSKKITIVEEFVYKSGWLSLSLVTVTSFETEDHLIFSAITDDGIEFDQEQCNRLFSLNAEINRLEQFPENDIIGNLKSISDKNIEAILEINLGRNSNYFDNEIEKLDNWAEDKKGSLEVELKELDKEIRLQKSESKKILNLEDKVRAQKDIKDLEKKRNELRSELFKSQDEIDNAKGKLISEIEKRLQQNVETKELFVIRWTLN